MNIKKVILENAELALYLGVPVFNRTDMGITQVETEKIKRIYDWAMSEDGNNLQRERQNFKRFVDEHDRRRGTNFVETFPELEELYKNIKL